MIVAIMTTALSGTAWADEVVAYTLEPAATGGNAAPHNSYADAATTTINNIGWSVTGNSSMVPWRIGGKNLSSVNRELHSTTAISDNISKIEVTHGAASNITVNSWTVIVSKNSDFSNPVSTLTPTFAASTTTTITRPDGVDWSNCYYKFVYNVSVSGNTNRYILFSEAKFYKETGTVLTESDLSLSPTSLSFDLYNDKDSKTITCTTSSTGAITVSASEYVTTSVSGNTITVTPVKATPSPQTITVNQAADATYAAGEKTFTVTISNSTPAIVYEKVTNANQLVAGNEYILVASTSTSSYAMGNMGNNLRSNVEVTVDDDAVSIQGEPIAVLTLGGINGAWTFLASDNDEYLAYSGSNNQLHSSSDASAAASKWVITDDFQLESANVAGRYLQYNASSPRFACYTGTQTDAFLYVKQGGAINTKVAPGYSFSAATAEAILGEQFTAPTFSNPNNVSVTFASSDPTVATISNAGVVTLVAVGTTVISATSVEDETYEAGTASYTLTVVDPNASGSVNNPYTVAQAIENTPASGTSDDVYVHGIVSGFYKDNIMDDGSNYRYYISDDGTSTNQLLVYKGKGLNNVAFADADDLLVGDEVTIKGGLTTYNSTKEIASGNYIVSLQRPVVQYTLAVTASANVEIFTYVGNNEAVEGTTTQQVNYGTVVGLSVSADEGYVLTLEVDGDDVTSELDETGYYEFTMPSHNVTVTATADEYVPSVEGTIVFCNSGTKINDASVTGDDSMGNTWTITTEGTTSYTPNANYCQVGSSSKPATSITFTTTLPAEATITSFEAKFGGYNDTAGDVTLKVGDTTVGTGSLDGTNDVIVSNTSTATGTVLTVTVTNIAKGVKCYYISYEVEAETPTEPITVTLNAYGYATFASTQVLDFTNTEADGLTAWAVTAVNGTAITFSQITGAIPAGTGVLLKGTASTEYTLTTGTEGTAVTNLLEGVTSPKTITADQYYGLKNDKFVKVNAGQVPAGKALLPAEYVGSNPVKAFTFVFEDDATGISNLNVNDNLNGAIYNVAGQRLNKMQKGINIVNGKKVLK